MNIATVLRYVDMKRGEVWDDRYYTMNDYMQIGKKYGVGMIAVMSEHAIDDICKHCDGLIIQGSATDIDPKYYGGVPLAVAPPVDEYYLDSLLIKHFYEAGKPIFGICGGEQELNVYFGGTIARMPAPHGHYLENPLGNHPINIVEGSFVYDVFGSTRAEVNSFHNWWTDKVAPDLKVVATSDDGIVEALEWKEKNIFATQWHPEQSFHRGDIIENKFFENFLKKCEECR